MGKQQMATQEDLSLPKATVSKLIKEMLPDDITCANDTRDLILECCVEFIHLLSSEANEVCTKDKKKTIAPEHILKSLKTLGFEDYNDQVEIVHQEVKEQVQGKSKRLMERKNLDIPEEELLKQQQDLFNRARNALRTSQMQLSESQELALNESTDQLNMSASLNDSMSEIGPELQE